MVAGKPRIRDDLKIFCKITQNQSDYFDVGKVESTADTIKFGPYSKQVRGDMIKYGFSCVHNFEFGYLANRMCQIYRAHLLR
jgi:hypothetical protein